MLVHLLVLRHVIEEVSWIRRIVDDAESSPMAPIGRLPVAKGELLDPRVEFVTADLLGRATTLFFIGIDSLGKCDLSLLSSVEALWHRSGGNLYLVCRANYDKCHEATSELRAAFEAHGHYLPVISDANGEFHHACSVERTPTGVELDEETRVLKQGRGTKMATRSRLESVSRTSNV
jgi:hypothetical protein